jgi:hypothetical protein
VVVKPTTFPVCRKMWAMRRVVVVFPFVPVTAMTGMVAGVPGG